LWLSLAGIGLGVVMSLGAAQVLRAALGSAETSVATFAAVSATLFVVTMLAAYVPALRASRVPPTQALRYE